MALSQVLLVVAHVRTNLVYLFATSDVGYKNLFVIGKKRSTDCVVSFSTYVRMSNFSAEMDLIFARNLNCSRLCMEIMCNLLCIISKMTEYWTYWTKRCRTPNGRPIKDIMLGDNNFVFLYIQ